jgi:hypothetical protein
MADVDRHSPVGDSATTSAENPSEYLRIVEERA